VPASPCRGVTFPRSASFSRDTVCQCPIKPRKVGDKIRVSMQMHGGDVVDATIKAVIETASEPQYQIDFGNKQTATVTVTTVAQASALPFGTGLATSTKNRPTPLLLALVMLVVMVAASLLWRRDPGVRWAPILALAVLVCLGVTLTSCGGGSGESGGGTGTQSGTYTITVTENELRLDHTDALREFIAGGEVNAHLLRRPARILAAK
jgi:hypothetical protein